MSQIITINQTPWNSKLSIFGEVFEVLLIYIIQNIEFFQ